MVQVAPTNFPSPISDDVTLRGYSATPGGQPCGEDFLLTVGQIAAKAGGGGGGVNQYVSVNTGTTTVTGILGDYYGFSGTDTSPKFINAPAATGSLKAIGAGDVAGTAFTYPINFVPHGSDTVIGNQTQLYTNGGTASWIDLAPGLWGMQ